MERLTLFPHGLPLVASVRDRCLELVHAAGGDLRRVIDGPSGSVAAFARFVSRARVLERLPSTPLVVFTKTVPVATSVIRARRELIAFASALETATYLLFHDATDAPQFFESAEALGEFDDRLSHAPIWTGPDGARWLVVSSLTRVSSLRERVDVLEREQLTSSAVVRVAPA
ncbi:MAG: hypothetical protein IT376_17605, partial [Polyangiaceae bacterium]|nr:hypothetical protein [Polyangiaceae bacterium]